MCDIIYEKIKIKAHKKRFSIKVGERIVALAEISLPRLDFEGECESALLYASFNGFYSKLEKEYEQLFRRAFDAVELKSLARPSVSFSSSVSGDDLIIKRKLAGGEGSSTGEPVIDVFSLRCGRLIR